MRRLEICLGLIQQDEAYLLQRRGDDPRIGAAGLIGAFGGKIEPGESPAEAVSRELSEETSVAIHHARFEYMGQVEVESDHKLEPVQIVGHVFRLILSNNMRVVADEGELVRLTKENALRDKHLLTPATRAAFEELI